MFRSCPPWRRCRDIPTLLCSFLASPVAPSVGTKLGKRGVTQSWLQKRVLIKGLMATLCCSINKTSSLPRAKVPVNKRLLLPSAFSLPLKSGEVEEEGGGVYVGVLLVVLVVWKVDVVINSAPATCILASVVRFKAFWWWWIYWTFTLQLLRSFLLAFWRRWIRWFGMCGAGPASVAGWDLFTV